MLCSKEEILLLSGMRRRMATRIVECAWRLVGAKVGVDDEHQNHADEENEEAGNEKHLDRAGRGAHGILLFLANSLAG